MYNASSKKHPSQRSSGRLFVVGIIVKCHVCLIWAHGFYFYKLDVSQRTLGMPLESRVRIKQGLFYHVIDMLLASVHAVCHPDSACSLLIVSGFKTLTTSLHSSWALKTGLHYKHWVTVVVVAASTKCVDMFPTVFPAVSNLLKTINTLAKIRIIKLLQEC